MLRTALACCALIACKGAPEEDMRVPAQAPVTSEPADAEVPDAPSPPCFAIPFTADAESAGIRRLAHRVPPATKAPAKKRDAVKLVVGKPTIIPGLKPWKPAPLGMREPPPPRPPLSVVEVIGAEALVAMAKFPNDKVSLVAPAHLEGAVVAITGGTRVTLAIGDSGAATLARYREHYVKPRLAETPREGDRKVQLEPLAVMLDDVDGDGTPEQIAFSLATLWKGDTGRPQLEVGILWATGELAYARVDFNGADVRVHHLVPPTLSGGTLQLVSAAGAQFVLDGKTLTKLPAVAGDQRCLQTSATEPAVIRAAP